MPTDGGKHNEMASPENESQKEAHLKFSIFLNMRYLHPGTNRYRELG